jgi:hypothetical protein
LPTFLAPMGFKASLFLSLSLPVTFGAVIILLTMYIVIEDGTRTYTAQMQDYMITDAKDNINLAVTATQQKIQSDYAQLVIFMSALSNLQYLLTKGKVLVSSTISTSIASAPASVLNAFDFDAYDAIRA